MRAHLSLTSRLTLITLAVVALLAVAIGTATTLAMRADLTGQLDDAVLAAAQRADGPPPGTDGPGGRGPRDDAEACGDGVERLVAGNQAPGTLIALVPGTDGGREGVVLTDQVCEGSALSDAQLDLLAQVPADGRVRPLDLGEQGGYRVVAVRAPDGVRVSGLPTAGVDDAVASLVVYELGIGAGALLAAGAAAALIVRRQLRPLRQVAATAHEVSGLPLADGEVRLEGRVPADLRDERTEVGRVGSALDALLREVQTAIAARHRSEQQVRQFVADASHELRTPLATIKGYAELARRRPDDADAAATALGKVEGESVRMTRLVEDLLMLARLDAARPAERTRVDLTLLVVTAVEDARILAPDHRWLLRLPERPVELDGDEHGLHRLVSNLLTNARRHTPPGTRVTVGLEERDAPGGPIVVLTVADDGPGLPPGLAPHAFDRFTRGDAARTRGSQLAGGTGGTGLGLALVQAIAHDHGGSAALRSAPGDTEIVVTVPKALR